MSSVDVPVTSPSFQNKKLHTAPLTKPSPPTSPHPFGEKITRLLLLQQWDTRLISLTKTSDAFSRTAGKTTAMSPMGRHEGRGNKQTPHEASVQALKAAFEAQPGDTRLIMVVAVHGVRPPAPHAPRSLDGYCAIVRDRGGFEKDYRLRITFQRALILLTKRGV